MRKQESPRDSGSSQPASRPAFAGAQPQTPSFQFISAFYLFSLLLLDLILYSSLGVCLFVFFSFFVWLLGLLNVVCRVTRDKFVCACFKCRGHCDSMPV